MCHVKCCRPLLQRLIDAPNIRFNFVPMYAVRGHMFPARRRGNHAASWYLFPRAAAISLAATDYFVPLMLRINKLLFIVLLCL